MWDWIDMSGEGSGRSAWRRRWARDWAGELTLPRGQCGERARSAGETTCDQKRSVKAADERVRVVGVAGASQRAYARWPRAVSTAKPTAVPTRCIVLTRPAATPASVR